MKLFFIAVISIVLMSCTSYSTNTSNIQSVTATELHASWDVLLQKNIVSINNGTSTEINYAGMKESNAQLNGYIASLQNVSLSTYKRWTRNEQLAFLINAYNAYTVQLILTKYPDLVSIKDLGDTFSSPWAQDVGLLLGEVRTLNGIEHTMIRGKNGFDEPRIHFAVNCTSIGCPALRAEAFTGKKLEMQLEEQTTLFLADRTRNRFQDDTLYVSKIFDWYRGDFEAGWKGTESLADFLVLYANALALTSEQVQALQGDEMDIVFFDYDWNLNDTKK